MLSTLSLNTVLKVSGRAVKPKDKKAHQLERKVVFLFYKELSVT